MLPSRSQRPPCRCAEPTGTTAIVVGSSASGAALRSTPLCLAYRRNIWPNGSRDSLAMSATGKPCRAVAVAILSALPPGNARRTVSSAVGTRLIRAPPNTVIIAAPLQQGLCPGGTGFGTLRSGWAVSQHDYRRFSRQSAALAEEVVDVFLQLGLAHILDRPVADSQPVRARGFPSARHPGVRNFRVVTAEVPPILGLLQRVQFGLAVLGQAESAEAVMRVGLPPELAVVDDVNAETALIGDRVEYPPAEVCPELGAVPASPGRA